MALKYEKVIKARAKESELERKRTFLNSKKSHDKKIKTHGELANIAGVSKDTIGIKFE